MNTTEAVQSKNPAAFMKSEYLCLDNKMTPPDSMLIQLNPVHLFTNLLRIHFTIVNAVLSCACCIFRLSHPRHMNLYEVRLLTVQFKLLFPLSSVPKLQTKHWVHSPPVLTEILRVPSVHLTQKRVTDVTDMSAYKILKL
jgi:hypothetical protein